MREKIVKIWKYQVFKGENRIIMPVGSIPLSIKIQHFQPVIWFLVPVDDSGRASEEREKFNIYGCETGKRYFMDPADIFLGTTLTKDDSYVLHFFWLGGKSYPC
jgi:hypothetical protein